MTAFLGKVVICFQELSNSKRIKLKWYERRVKEDIYLTALKYSMIKNVQGGREGGYHVSIEWSNILYVDESRGA